MIRFNRKVQAKRMKVSIKVKSERLAADPGQIALWHPAMARAVAPLASIRAKGHPAAPVSIQNS
ncbi:hypothetical protein [Acidocella aquatica]|uniref:hypothetical protein n=1 Tax=Acidocella aquatica TaxID=1922313 RepID=UPI0024E05250|nr:hypothetical protein [Acidocella aquatica]